VPSKTTYDINKNIANGVKQCKNSEQLEVFSEMTEKAKGIFVNPETAVNSFIEENQNLSNEDLQDKWHEKLMKQKASVPFIKLTFEIIWKQQPWKKTDKQRAFKKFNALCKNKNIGEIKKFSDVLMKDMWDRHNYVNGRPGSWKQKFVTYLDSKTWEDEDMPTVFEDFKRGRSAPSKYTKEELEMSMTEYVNHLASQATQNSENAIDVNFREI